MDFLKRNFNRYMSMLMAVVMCASLVSPGALAVSDTGSSSAQSVAASSNLQQVNETYIDAADGAELAEPATFASDVSEAKTPQDIPGYKYVDYNEDIQRVYSHKDLTYIQGYPDKTVGPERFLNRSEAVTIFYRLYDGDFPSSVNPTASNPFRDVPSNAWYYTELMTLYQIGLINGDSFGNFRPSDPITRAELSAIATRFNSDKFNKVNKSDFTDVDRNSWYYDSVSTAQMNGWVTGYPDGTFKPENCITRAETITIINRVINRAVTVDRLEELNVTCPYIDINSSHWAYTNIMEASIKHTAAEWHGLAFNDGEYNVVIERFVDQSGSEIAQSMTSAGREEINTKEIKSIPPYEYVGYVKTITYNYTKGDALPSITKSADVESAYAGDPVIYTITLSNNEKASSPWENVVLTDEIPEAMTFVDSSVYIDGKHASFTFKDGKLTVPMPKDIEPGTSTNVSFKVTVNKGFDGEIITNTAVAKGDNGVAKGKDTSFSATDKGVEILKGVALPYVSKKTDVSEVKVGDQFVYTITAGNSDEATYKVENARVSDVIPAGLEFVPGSVRVNDASVEYSYTDDTRTVTIPLGDIEPGQEVEAKLTVQVAEHSYDMDIQNSVTLKGDNVEPVDATDDGIHVKEGTVYPFAEKSSNKVEAKVGDMITYYVTAGNRGDAEYKIKDAVFSDVVPEGLVFIGNVLVDKASAEYTYDKDTRALSIKLGDIEPGTQKFITFDVRVEDTSFGKTINNTANIDGENIDRTDASDGGIVISDGFVDPFITKSVDKETAKPGDDITYTISLGNSSFAQGNVKDAVFTDVIPEGITFVGNVLIDNEAVKYNYDRNTGILKINLGNIAPGTTENITFDAKIDANTYGMTLVNKATMSSSNVGDVNAADPGVYVEKGTPVPYAIKTCTSEQAVVGDIVVYNIEFGNDASADYKIENAVLVDVIPEELNFVYGSIRISDVAAKHIYSDETRTLTVELGDMEPGETVNVRFAAKVNPDTYGKTIENTAVLNGDNIPATIANHEGGLKIVDGKAIPFGSKTARTTDVKIGDTLTYDIQVGNRKFAEYKIENAVVTDVIPDSLTFIGNVLIDNKSVNYEFDRNTKTLSVVVGDVAPGETYTLSFDARVNDGTYSQTITNDAVISGDNIENIPVSDSTVNVAAGKVKPYSYKTVNKETASTGELVVYTITVGNDEEAEYKMSNVVVHDVMPKGTEFQYGSVRLSNNDNYGNDFNDATQELTVWLNDIEPGESIDVQFAVRVNKDAYGTSLANTAYVEGDNFEMMEPSVDGPFVNEIEAMPFIVKSASTNIADIGEKVTYTLTVGNDKRSESVLKNAVVYDYVPDGISFLGNVLMDKEAVLYNFDKDTGTLSVDIGTMKPGQVATITFDATVDKDTYNKDIVNTAGVTADNAPYVEAEDAGVVVVDGTKTPFASKTADRTDAKVGDIIVYSIKVGNGADAEYRIVNPQIVDEMPENVDFIFGSVRFSDDGAASYNYNDESRVLTIDMEDLEPGEMIDVQFAVKVREDAYHTEIVNNAAFNGDNIDSINVSDDGVIVSDIEAMPTFSKTANTHEASVNDEVTYIMHVANNRRSASILRDPYIVDVLPAGVTFLGNVRVDNDSVEYNYVDETRELTIALGDMDPGQEHDVRFDVTIDKDSYKKVIKNTATLYADNGQTLTDTDTGISVDMGKVKPFMTKTASSSTANVDDILVYTVTIGNKDTAEYKIENAIMTDVIPEGLEFMYGSVRLSDGGALDYDFNDSTKTLTVNVGDIEPNTSYDVQFAVRVLRDTNSKTFTNTATVTGDNIDTMTASDTGVTINDIFGDMYATKEASESMVEKGEKFTYTVTIGNSRQAHATLRNIQMTDVIPEGLVFDDNVLLNGDDTDYSYNQDTRTLTVPVGDLDAAQEAKVSFDVIADTHNVMITNTAEITADNADPVTATDPGVQLNDILAKAIGSKTSSARVVSVGEIYTYFVTIGNCNQSRVPMRNAVVTDPIHPGLTFLGNVLIDGKATTDYAFENSILTVNVGDIAPGEQHVVSFDVEVKDNMYNQTIQNYAVLSSDNSKNITVTDCGSGNTCTTYPTPIPTNYPYPCPTDPNPCNPYPSNPNPGPSNPGPTNPSNPSNPGGCGGVVVKDCGVTVSDGKKKPYASKTADKTKVQVGDIIVYSIKVGNGEDAEYKITNPTISDVIPEGAQFVFGSVRFNDNDVVSHNYNDETGELLIRLRDLLPGQAVDVQFAVKVLEGFNAKTVQNTATFDGTNIDPIVVSDSGVMIEDIIADPYASKTSDLRVVNVNEKYTYYVTVGNSKQAHAVLRNANMTDVIPDGVTFAGNVLMDNHNTAYSFDKATRTLSVPVGDLIAGQEVVIAFDVIVDADSYNRVIVNTATITSDNGDTLEVTDLGSCCDVGVTVTDGIKKPYITKTANKRESAVGDTITYSIKAGNGACAEYKIENGRIVDKIPDGVEFNQGSVLINGSHVAYDYDVATRTLTIPIGDIEKDSYVAVEFSVTVSAGSNAKIISNEAAYESDNADTIYASDEGVVIKDIMALAMVSKTVNTDVADIGDTVTYTITAKNSVLSHVNARNAYITDVIPEGLTFRSNVRIGGTSVAYDYDENSRTLIVPIGSIAPGQSIDVKFDATVNKMTYNQVIENTAKLTSENTEPVESAVCNLTVADGRKAPYGTKTADKDTVNIGEEITYTVKFGNGPCGEDNIIAPVITDPIPEGTEFIHGSVYVNGINFRDYVFENGVLTVNLPDDIAKCSFVEMKFSVRVLDGYGAAEIKNIATLDGANIDPFDVEADSVLVNDVLADPVITKTADVDSIDVDEHFNYIIHAGNSEQAHAVMRNAVVVDVIPEELDFHGTVLVNGKHVDYDYDIETRTLSVPIGDLAPGEYSDISFVVAVKDRMYNKTITNIATLISDNSVPKDAENSQVVVADSKQAPYGSKTPNKSTVSIGETITYDVKFGNGPCATFDILDPVITDVMPEGTDFVQGSVFVNGKNHTDYDYDTNTKTLKVYLSDIERCTFTNMEFSVIVLNGYNATEIKNIATLDGSNIDPFDVEAPVVLVDDILADPMIVKTADVDTIDVDEHFTYTVTVGNSEQAHAVMRNAVMTDVIPEELNFHGTVLVNGTHVDYDYDTDSRTLSVPVGDLNPGQYANVSFVVSVKDRTYNKTIKNVATLTSDNSVPKDAENTQVTVANSKEAPYGSKTPNKSTVKVGENIVYDVKFGNGPCATFDILDPTITDTMPEGTEFVDGSVYVNGKLHTDYDYNTATKTLTVYLSDIERCSFTHMEFAVKVLDGYNATEIINTATLDGSNIDPFDVVAPVVIVEDIMADPVITKTADVDVIDVDERFNYTITAGNSDQAHAVMRNAVVTDVIPDELMFNGNVRLNGDSTAYNYDSDSHTLSVPVGDLDAGEFVDVSFEVVVKDRTYNKTIHNVGILTSDNSRQVEAVNDQVVVADSKQAPYGSKTANKETVKVGETVTWTVKFGNGPCATFDIVNPVITDTIPEGMEFVHGSVLVNGVVHDYEYDAATKLLTVHLSDIERCSFQNMQFSTKVLDGYNATEITNVATLDGDNIDPFNVEDTVRVDDIFADPWVAKNAESDLVYVGDRFFYSIPFGNSVQAHATMRNAVLTDVIPEELTFAGNVTVDGASVTYNYDKYTHTLSVPVGDYEAGQRSELSFEVIVNEGMYNRVITNVVELTSDNTEPVEATNDQVTIAEGKKSPYASKKADKKEVAVGDHINYTITVGNGCCAEDSIHDALYTDFIPEGVTFDAGSVTVNGNTVDYNYDTATRILTVPLGDIPVGEKLIVEFSVTVDADQYRNIIHNTGEVTGSDIDPIPVEDDSVIVLDGRTRPYTSKEADIHEAKVGDTVNFTIVYGNEEIADTSIINAVMTDIIPEGMDYVSGSAQIDGKMASEAGYDAETHVLTVPLGDVERGTEKVVTFAVVLNSDAYDKTIRNVEEVTADNAKPVKGEDTIIVERGITMPYLSKEGDKVEALPDEVVNYTIHYGNEKIAPDKIRGAVMVDFIPTGLEYVEGSVSVNNNVPENFYYDKREHTLNFNLGDVEPGEEFVIEYSAKVLSAAQGETMTNTVEVTAEEPTETLQDSWDLDVLKGEPRPDGAKTADKDVVEVGEDLVFTITYSNDIDANYKIENAVVTDPIPYGLDFQHGSVQVNGITHDYSFIDSTRTLVVELGDIAPGQTFTTTFTVTPNYDAFGTEIENVATLSGDNIEPFDRICDLISVPMGDTAPSIDKSATATQAKPGDVVSYIIKVSNAAGAKDEIRNPYITDMIPYGTTFVDGSVYVNGTASDYSFEDNTLTIPLENLPAGNTRTVRFDVQITEDAFGSTINNVATLDGDNMDPIDDDHDIEVPVGDTIPGIIKFHNKTEVNVGDVVTYTVVFGNHAAAEDKAYNVVLTDTLPDGMDYVTSSTSATSNLNGPRAITSEIDSSNSQVMRFYLGDVDKGEEITVTFLAKVNELAYGALLVNHVEGIGDNTVKVEWDDPGVLVKDGEAVPAIRKTVNKERAKVGDTLEYTIYATNEKAADVAIKNGYVVDSIDNLLDFMGGVTVDGKAANFDYDESSHLLTVYLGDVEPNQTCVIKYLTEVTDQAYGQTITNFAILDGDNIMPKDTDNVVFTDIEDGLASLNISKVSDRGEYEVGDPITYTIQVGNDVGSQVAAKNVTVEDVMPDCVDFQNGSVVGGYGYVSYDASTRLMTAYLGDLDPNVSRVIKVNGVINAVTNEDSYTNVAVAYADNTDDVDDSCDIIVRGYTDPVPGTKSADKYEARCGDVITYTVTVHNSAAATAPIAPAVIDDPIPEGMTFLEGSVSRAEGGSFSSNYTTSDRNLQIKIDSLEPGETATFNFKVTIDQGMEGHSFTNVAHFEGTPIPAPPVVVPGEIVEPTITKTHTVDGQTGVYEVGPNTTIAYIVELTNNSTDVTWKNVKFDDQLPKDLEYTRTYQVDGRNATATFSNNTMNILIGDIAPLQTVRIEYLVSSKDASMINWDNSGRNTNINYARAIGDNGNCSTSDTIDVIGGGVTPPPVEPGDAPTIKKTINKEVVDVDADNTALYTITVSNNSNEVWRNVKLQDPINLEKLIYINDAIKVRGRTISESEYDLDGPNDDTPVGKMIIPLGDIDPHDSVEIQIPVEIFTDAVPNYKNTATATSDNYKDISSDVGVIVKSTKGYSQLHTQLMGGYIWEGDRSTQYFMPYNKEFGAYYNGINDYVTLSEVATTIYRGLTNDKIAKLAPGLKKGDPILPPHMYKEGHVWEADCNTWQEWPGVQFMLQCGGLDIDHDVDCYEWVDNKIAARASFANINAFPDSSTEDIIRGPCVSDHQIRKMLQICGQKVPSGVSNSVDYQPRTRAWWANQLCEIFDRDKNPDYSDIPSTNMKQYTDSGLFTPSDVGPINEVSNSHYYVKNSAGHEVWKFATGKVLAPSYHET